MSDPSTISKVFQTLRETVRGLVIRPTDVAYEPGRQVWNAAIDRRPAGIILCEDAEDVVLALQIAAEHGVKVTVRAGGHNVAGRSISDGAFVLDLSRLRRIAVNALGSTASVQGGTLWRDFDAATSPYGLATTGGFVSSTGVGGLTLGGGVGWLMRRYGLAADNVLSARVVLADGRSVRASHDEHDELFWGLRGGAGNLGVVTSFEFALHPVSQVLAGLVIYPAASAQTVLRAWRSYCSQAPDEFCSVLILINAPPFPFLDSAWHGKPIVVLAICWCGNLANGEREILPLRHLGGCLGDVIHPMPYAAWQTMQDTSSPPGRYQYWKTATYADLSDATLDILAERAVTPLGPECEIHVQHLGGAVSRVPLDETAFSHRASEYFVNILGVTSQPGDFEWTRANVRDFHEQISTTALPGQMPNFRGDNAADPAREFGPHALRLDSLRLQYDPNRLFVSCT